MPPGPRRLIVVGDIEVGNPGIQADLTRRVPSGFNPTIVMLDLHLVQRPGIWPQMVTQVQARYERVLRKDEKVDKVQVFYEGKVIEDLKVSTAW